MQCRSRPRERVIRQRAFEAGDLAMGLLGRRPFEGGDLAMQLIEAQAPASWLKHIHPVIPAARWGESWEMLRRFFVRGTEIAMLLDRTREVPRCSRTEKYLEAFLLHRMGKVHRQFINKRQGGRTEAAGCVEHLL